MVKNKQDKNVLILFDEWSAITPEMFKGLVVDKKSGPRWHRESLGDNCVRLYGKEAR